MVNTGSSTAPLRACALGSTRASPRPLSPQMAAPAPREWQPAKAAVQALHSRQPQPITRPRCRQ